MAQVHFRLNSEIYWFVVRIRNNSGPVRVDALKVSSSHFACGDLAKCSDDLPVVSFEERLRALEKLPRPF